MRRALDLAATGLGRVAPNPSVGCVIVANGEIVGAARTQDGGRPHAEEVALDQAGQRARGATAYVTLEPCGARSSGVLSCAARLVESGIARVVYAAADPHARASGAGLRAITDAGISLEAGPLRAEAERLNAGFFSLVKSGLPLVEIAETGEGYDAELVIAVGETAMEALLREGRAGRTRVWAPAGTETARLVAALLRR